MTKCCGQEGYESGRPQHDRRLQLIDDIKQLIGDMDRPAEARGGGKQCSGGGVNVARARDMERECLQYRKRRECSPPTITSIGVHETRPTSIYDSMKYESSKRLTYVDATRGATDAWDPMPPAPWELPRTPSQELRAGTLYTSCDCRKRNGLQHDCQRWDCGGRPTCVAVNPGPCCEPSKARKPVRGDRRNSSGAQPDSLMTKSNIPPTSTAREPYSRAQAPTAGVKEPPSMVCLCTSVGTSQPPGPVTPGLTSLATQTPRQQFTGIVAVSSPTPNNQCVGLPPPAQAMHGQGQGGQYHQQTVGGMLPAPAHSRTRGEFVAISPSGGKFLCCPMSS